MNQAQIELARKEIAKHNGNLESAFMSALNADIRSKADEAVLLYHSALQKGEITEDAGYDQTTTIMEKLDGINSAVEELKVLISQPYKAN